jgi:hypothetical protein
LRNHVIPHLGPILLENLTPERVEHWAVHEIDPDRVLANRTREKAITVFHGVMERARKLYKLPENVVADVEKPRTASRTEINVFSPEEIAALVRAADSEQDGAIFLTAAFTGLRQGELIALRWRDVDFPNSAIRVRASYTNGHLTSPKSGKVRSVPMATQVAEALARLRQREFFTTDDHLVFAGIVGGYLDGSALSKRYRAALVRAGLRPLRFHDYADLRVMPTWPRYPGQSLEFGGDQIGISVGDLQAPLSRLEPGPDCQQKPVRRRCLEAFRSEQSAASGDWRLKPTVRRLGLCRPDLGAYRSCAGRSKRGRHNEQVGIIVVMPTSA